MIKPGVVASGWRGKRGIKIVMHKMVTENSQSRKGGTRHSLSSGAYFDDRYEKYHKQRTSRDSVTGQIDNRKTTSAQQRRIRHEQPNQITVYADMIKVSMPDEINGRRDRDPEKSGGGIRGDIVGFSRASRKRMIEFMAKVRDDGDLYFVTMTYDDYSWITHCGGHQDQWEAFRRRIERAYQVCKALWRVELKEHKSGDLIGQLVPHFHMLVWTGGYNTDENKEKVAKSLRDWGVKAWGEILETENPQFANYGFHVSSVRNRKHAYSYVSKYIGKQDDDDIPCGRRWGRIGKFDCLSSETICLTDDEATYFKRLVKRWLRNKNTKFAQRFSRVQSTAGYTVFGLGDGMSLDGDYSIIAGIHQFIVEVRRWSAENDAREAGHGN